MLGNTKKAVSLLILSTMIICCVQIAALGAGPTEGYIYTAPVTAETQFSEDFEDYQILKLADEYNAAYYAGISVYSSVIDVAQPSDDAYYTTYADKYPNGTASVYEGNLADAGMKVPDPAGNQIYGGTKFIGQDDGWFGYYNGASGNYNIYNRRLSVMSRNGTSEINQTQYASLNPRATASAGAISSLNRNNVALGGYSYLSARVNISADTSGKNVGKAGIAITKNPSYQTDRGNYDAVYFTDSETTGMLDVYFNGSVIGQIAKSTFSYTSSAVTSTGEWYTIQYRLYNRGGSSLHKITIIDDLNKTVVADTDWASIDFEAMDSSFNFSGNTYGIRFYAEAAAGDTECPRLRLDDISFYNGGFTENFNGYNIATATGPSNRIGNGPKGNRNTAAYANGVYEGNMAKNVFVHHVLSESTTNYDTMFGNITGWQGYVKKTKTIAGVRDMRVNDKWQFPCTVVSPTSRGQGANGFDTQALVLRANATKTNVSQAVYAGMDKVDFADITKLSAVVKVQASVNSDESLTLQLTKGRDTAVAADADYSGSSHTAYYDVFKMQNEKFYVGKNEIGSFEIGGAYRFEYTVDRTDKVNPKHMLKIYNNVTGALVGETSLTAMNLTSGASSFNFDNDVTGFRFVNNAPTASTSDIVTYIDDVKIEKDFESSVKGISYFDLSVDTTDILKDVKRGSYGINFEWGANPELYLTNDYTATNPLFINTFRDNIPIARMAGVSANYMLWKEAIGDFADRSDLKFWHYDARKQYYGPVEWIESVKTSDADAKLIYTVNLPRELKNTENLSGDPDQIETGATGIENLKDLVRFMRLNPSDANAVGSDGVNWAQKRVDCGITDPVDIYAWELGCELDSKGQGGYTKEEYVEMCEAAITAIRAIDPTAKIAAHERTSIKYSDTLTNAWHNYILSELGDDIDYLSIHYYYVPDDYAWFDSYLNNLNNAIAASPAAGKIKLLFTEHSTKRISQDVSAGYDYDLPHTLKGTLATAEFLTELMARPEIEATMYHSIASGSWALRYEKNGEYKKTAPGYVLDMFGKKAVGNSVSCTVTRTGGTEANISAAAIKTDKGTNLVLVNTNEGDAVIDLDNITGKLKKESIISGNSYESDTFKNAYKDVEEITYNENVFNTAIDSYTLKARSIVVLEFEENMNIISANTETGAVSYKIPGTVDSGSKLVLAGYNGTRMVCAKVLSEFEGTGSVNIGAGFNGATKIKIFLWNSDLNKPVCESGEYSLS